jgi:branched-subunit amino acid aminotransferase/4-amino-4-deoxychorismate lyase
LPDAQKILTVLAAGILKNRLERGVSRIVWPGSGPKSENTGTGLYVTFEELRPLPRAATLFLVSFKPSKWRIIKSIAVKEAAPLWHRAREQHCFDVLMQNEGDLLEASTGNLFLFRSGRLSTPCADGRILPGITRAFVLEQTALEAVERNHKRSWLKQMEACFVTNCARGIIPVARIVAENGRLVWEGDPRHRVILKTRKLWRRAMIASAALGLYYS